VQVAQSAALAEKFHYMCYALATYGQAAVAIFHFLREGKKLCVWGWFVRQRQEASFYPSQGSL